MEKKYDSFKEQSEFWDQESSANQYCNDFITYAIDNKWIEMLTNIEKKKNIHVSGSILELGGGSQYLSRFLAKNRNCNIICTDVSPKRISDFNAYYNEDLSNLKTDGTVNASKLPYADNSFDFIIGEAMLHHIEDFRSATLEINRCLKPNGKAIFLREPIAGLDNLIIKRPLKKLLYKNRKKFNEQYEEFLVLNRYEFDKTYFQWIEEFERGGFDCEFHQGWYAKNFTSLYKSFFPQWFSCLVTIYLEKKININQLDWTKLA